MEEDFEQLISSFLEKRVGISNDFLNVELASKLSSNMVNLYRKEALKLAGVGNNHLLNHNKDLRSDKIFWLDKKDEDPHEILFFDLIDAFVSYLNQTCYTAIKSYEFHYALYEKGTFYKRHLDQFKTNNSRAFSMIMYLNDGWVTGDGGELKIYQNTEIQLITPDNRKCVFFKSDELEHEVVLSNTIRKSINGWLKTSL